MASQTDRGFTCEVWLESTSDQKVRVQRVPTDKSKVKYCIRATNLHSFTCIVDLEETRGVNKPPRVAFEKATSSAQENWTKQNLMTLPPASPSSSQEDTQRSGVWNVDNNSTKETIKSKVKFTYNSRPKELTVDLTVDL